LIREVHGLSEHMVVGADEGKAPTLHTTASEAFEDVQVTDLDVRKDETLQHNLLPSGCFKRGSQISQGDGRSAFRVSKVDVAERCDPIS